MFGFVRGVRGVRGRAVVLVVAGLLGGVTASSVAAATKTTVTWKVSSLTAGQVKSLSAIASTNSPGVKTWSKAGSCTLTPINTPRKLTMGLGESCALTLRIAKAGEYLAKMSTKIITRKSTTTTTTVAATTMTTVAATTMTTVATTTTTTVATTRQLPIVSTTTTVAGLRPPPVVLVLCRMGGPCALGDTGPGGGRIFYKDLTRAAGSQYFEVSCLGWSDGTCGGSDLEDKAAEWGCYKKSIQGADGTAIGTGEQNTADIVYRCAERNIAAKFADDLVLGGYNDWFLPSKDELNALCKWAYNDTVNQFCQDDDDQGSFSLRYNIFFLPNEDAVKYYYWSSSEYDGDRAWKQNMLNDKRHGYAKTCGDFCVIPRFRPVRSF